MDRESWEPVHKEGRHTTYIGRGRRRQSTARALICVVGFQGCASAAMKLDYSNGNVTHVYGVIES